MSKKGKGKGTGGSKRKSKGRNKDARARASTWDDAGPDPGSLPPLAEQTPRHVDDAIHARRIAPTELAARLASLSTVLQRGLAHGDSGDGLTRARLSALALLVLGGPRTLGELAAAERVRPPTMTRLVHAMEADGLVIRAANPDDGRSVIIRATPRGETLLERGRAGQIAPLADRIAGLSENERVLLEESSDVLGRLLRDPDWARVEPERDARERRAD